MSVGRLLGVIVVILVLFAIISDPQDSAETTRNGASNVAGAGSQVVVFISTIIGDLSEGASSSGTSSSSGSSSSGSSSSSGTSVSRLGDSTPTYPRGGIETGDGSAAPRG